MNPLYLNKLQYANTYANEALDNRRIEIFFYFY